MLTSRPTKKMLAEWKRLYEECRPNMKPNRKSGIEVDEYFRDKYDYREWIDVAFENVVVKNILCNEFYREKLRYNKVPVIRTYTTENVYVGIDVESGFFHIESEDIEKVKEIHDDLVRFRGLDEKDLENIFLVAEYVKLSK